MKISKKLPQFERFPALFISSGEYEANFYLAFDGKFEEKKSLKNSPREEAKEKQGFIGRKAGMQSLSAVSHHGRYIADLKMKFSKKIHAIIHDILAEDKRIEEIYIFAPKYVAKRIFDNLDKYEQKKVRMQFYKQYSKSNPIDLIQIFQKEIEEIQKNVAKTPEKNNLITLHK